MCQNFPLCCLFRKEKLAIFVASKQQNMKRLQYRLAGLCMLLAAFTACQSGPDEVTTPDGQCTVTFSVSNYRQVSFDDLSGSAAGTSRATISMTLANLSLTVFDAETNERVIPTILHKSTDYESDGETAMTFPQFSVSLPYGHYRLLVLGYNGSHDCNIAAPNHISWTDDYVPNTFCYCEEFTLNEGASLNKEITLKHVVAAFRVTAEDAIPADLKKMRFSSTAGGTVLDATTGFAQQSTGRTSEISVPSSYAGAEGVDFTVYLFLPQEQITSNYTVQALGQNDALISEKHFYDVPLRINYLTQWQGKAFEASGEDVPAVQSSFNIGWDMEWAGTLSVN